MAETIDRAEPRRVLKHCEALGLDARTLASCLGVNPKTIQRWRDGSAQPNETGLRALEKLETIYRLAVRLLKKDGLRPWFQSPNATLGGERPAELLSRGELDQVICEARELPPGSPLPDEDAAFIRQLVS